MPKTVKLKVAKMKRKPRTRRVSAKKTVKVDARVSPEERAAFFTACDDRDQVRAKVLRRLLKAYVAAVNGGRINPTDKALEVRSIPGEPGE